MSDIGFIIQNLRERLSYADDNSMVYLRAREAKRVVAALESVKILNWMKGANLVIPVDKVSEPSFLVIDLETGICKFKTPKKAAKRVKDPIPDLPDPEDYPDDENH